VGAADKYSMDGKRVLTRGSTMIQWVGVLIALLGFAYNGVKDYQSGNIKIPTLPKKEVLTKPVYPVQYCLMAYDPNVDKILYQHENGQWYDQPPQIRKYQDQSQEVLGSTDRAQYPSVRLGHNGQSPQASAYTQRY
jgi:hypothetical protein